MRDSNAGEAGRLRPGSATGDAGNGETFAERLRAPVFREWGSDLRPGDSRLAGPVPTARVEEPDTGTLPGGWRGSPRGGRTDGGALRRPGGDLFAAGPRFDETVVANGYRWWYIDALSDDRRYGLTIIVFVGSVFSPYYAWARRRGDADPESFCSINAILYNPRSKYWALTERGAGDLARSARRLDVGPSAIYREGDGYCVDINEVTVPLPRRLRGQVRLFPAAMQDDPVTLEEKGRHRWWPIAPVGRVEVDFREPDLRWSGAGYFDSNWGEEPLEQGFSQWHWSRAELDDGSVAVLYAPNSRRSGLTEQTSRHKHR